MIVVSNVDGDEGDQPRRGMCACIVWDTWHGGTRTLSNSGRRGRRDPDLCIWRRQPARPGQKSKRRRGGGPIGQANTMREEWVTLDSIGRLDSQVEERSEGAEWSGRRTWKSTSVERRASSVERFVERRRKDSIWYVSCARAGTDRWPNRLGGNARRIRDQLSRRRASWHRVLG
jgi:hypothetical protein